MALLRKILLVDDSSINRAILRKILKDDYDVLEAENGKLALECLYKMQKSIAAVLLDIAMLVMNGYEVMEVMRQDKILSKIPVIIMTGNDKEDTEEKALKLGANDFLVKPYKPMIIKQRLANIIKLRETAAFVNSAEKDPLTGLFNKTFFYERVETLLKENPKMSYDIICCDIERFKLVNDLFGEKVGDELLKYVAAFVREQMDDMSICGRIGTDQFACLMPHREVYESRFFEEANRRINQFPVTINLKVCYGIYTVDDLSVPVSSMCDRALIAGRSVKGKYDVYYAYYDESFRQALIAEQMIVDSMKTAIVEKQFQVYYQPQYDLITEKITGAEALVRWIHPQKGFLSPGEFIPIFEKNGFITELDIYVWDRVCQNLRRWIDSGKTITPISVNVSRADIYNPNIHEIIIGLVKKYDLDPKYMHLEITETAYTENPGQLIEVVNRLKCYGFIIEMDDFGSGYSSLNMLSELPLNNLKLDMKFIQNETAKNNSKNILSFVISLAKWLDLRVIAEGVETKAQLEALRNMACDYVQGYYYAKPMPLDEFEAHLEKAQVEDIDVVHELPTVGNGSIRVIESQLDKVMVIVDDIELNRAILAEIFTPYYTIVEADNGKTAYSYITEHADTIAIVLLDLVMPVMDGFQFLDKLRKNETTQKIPVIVTSQAAEDSEARALAMGAADFIAKPYSQEVALRRVENVIAMHKVSKLEEENMLYKKMQEMEKKAKTDALTGLYNRAELEARMTEFFDADHKLPSTFIMLDIDNFKLVNDTLGHIKGDETIQKVAEILKSCFRDEDLVCRMGGDEFAVFIKIAFTQEDLNKRLSMLCQKLRFIIEDMTISCSVGACVSPIYGNDYQSLYQNADMALLTAKRLGKNQYQVFGGAVDLPSHVLFRNMDWLMDEASDAVFVCDAEDYALLYLNDVACHIAGKAKKECIGKKCYSAIWNRTEPCTHCIHIEALTDDFCEQEVSPEGSGRSFLIKGKRIEWGGQAARIQYVQDNTEKAVAAKHLSDISMDRKRLLDLMPGGIFRYRANGDGEFDFVSKNMLNMLGYTRTAFEAKFNNRFEEMVWCEDRKRVQKEIDDQIAVGDTDECDYRIEKGNGELCWVHDVGRLVVDESGKEWFYVTIIDMTLQHNLQTRLEKEQKKLQAALDQARGVQSEKKISKEEKLSGNED